METRYLGKDRFAVSALGLGCMGMSYAYGGLEESQAIHVIRSAVDMGVTLLDTAEMYGPYENEVLVGKAVKGIRDNVQIATKFGFRILPSGKGRDGVDSRPEHIREAVEGSLKRLDIETIDLLYQHRLDPAVPIETVVETMSDLVKEGKVLHLGLSEVSPATLRRANSVHPITAVQSEYSLWSREPEAGVLETCRELGVGFVAYSPLGRGFLTGAIKDQSDLSQDDSRRNFPRFQEDVMEENRKLLDRLQAIADKYRCTLAQLSLAWLLNKGDDIVPIPGARKMEHLEDNVAAVGLVIDAADIQTIDTIFAPGKVKGQRYAKKELALIDE